MNFAKSRTAGRAGKTLTVAAAFAAAGAIGLAAGSPLAGAAPTTQDLGSQGKLVDAAGNVVQGWTISGLKVSSDVIPHPVYGTLWEATATDEAIQGGATPIISNLNARASNGQTYRVLFGAATPQGINPATLAQGEKATGKVYFDVVGAAPDSVVYNAGGEDLLVWVQAAASEPSTSSYTPSTPSSTGTAATESEAPETEGAAPGEPTATDEPTVPATEGVPGAPEEELPSGSSGTPLPEGEAAPTGSQGTPLPEGTQPASTEPGAESTAPADTAPADTAPSGSSGASGTPGSSGTGPTTTVVPAPVG